MLGNVEIAAFPIQIKDLWLGKGMHFAFFNAKEIKSSYDEKRHGCSHFGQILYHIFWRTSGSFFLFW